VVPFSITAQQLFQMTGTDLASTRAFRRFTTSWRRFR